MVRWLLSVNPYLEPAHHTRDETPVATARRRKFRERPLNTLESPDSVLNVGYLRFCASFDISAGGVLIHAQRE